MAWTAPRTYVDGEIITHTTLNTDIRDNLSFLDNHIHNNASGQGSSDLQGIDTIGFGDQGQDPAAATMQRNGASLFFHNAGSVVNIGGVSAAATASLRALGVANGTQGAPGTHVHALGAGSVINAQSVGGISDPFNGFAAAGSADVTVHTTGTSFLAYGGIICAPNTQNYFISLNGVDTFSGTVSQHTVFASFTGTIVPSGTYIVRAFGSATGFRVAYAQIGTVGVAAQP